MKNRKPRVRDYVKVTSIALAGVGVVALAATASETPPADPVAAIDPVRNADYYENGQPNEAMVSLGRLLFFDKILSGNRNISCGTCHHPTRGSGDAIPLSLGEGAVGLAENRTVVAEQPVLGRVPRNAQPLYNLGAREFARLYHDGPRGSRHLRKLEEWILVAGARAAPRRVGQCVGGAGDVPRVIRDRDGGPQG